MSLDRRINERLHVKRKIGILQSDRSVVYAWTHDLSIGGMQVLTEYNADIGKEFNAFMSVYDESRRDQVIIEFRLQVRHVLYDGSCSCFRIGMQILSFRGDSREYYERFIADRLLKMGTPIPTPPRSSTPTTDEV